MAYQVLKPLAYVRDDGKVVAYSRSGATVDDIPADQVEQLVAEGKLAPVGDEKPSPPSRKKSRSKTAEPDPPPDPQDDDLGPPDEDGTP